MNNNKYKLLLVEDEENIRNLVCAMLEAEGYQVLHAGTCAAANIVIASHLPDLILLDLGLPDGDGLTLLRSLRRDCLIPIIVLSARSDESDKVEALDLGANDYVTKPFGAAELMARVRSALRIHRHSAQEGRLPGGKFQVRELTIDYDARRVFLQGREIKLTQTEYNILALLSEYSGKVMTYSAIIKAVWGYPYEGSVKKLQVNMANIRKKMGEIPGVVGYIVNELGVGYRLCGDRE